MTELNSVNQNSIYNKIYNKQSSYSQNNEYKAESSKEKEPAPDTQKSEKKEVLSNSEINTLHMFFGSEKPEEMQFYGNNKVDTIHKGQFLDLKG